MSFAGKGSLKGSPEYEPGKEGPNPPSFGETLGFEQKPLISPPHGAHSWFLEGNT